ncbi:MAG: hypothetical protein WBP87_15820 [Candidatus Sulfotelmatobacter sp.]
MGGEPRYYLEQPQGVLMRISNLVRKCVGFVGIRGEGAEIKYGGTVFFVKISEDGLPFSYMVTAKHVAEELEGSDCVIRLNDKQGKSVILEATGVKWWYHPTESASVDSAVRPFFYKGHEHLDVTTIANTIFATREIIDEYEIGIGDEIYVAGLFTRVTETAKNQPVLRTGNLAMMPDEKIEFNKFGLIDAYLIETKSFSGLSGCPVFVRHTVSTPLTQEADGPPIGKFKRLYGGGSSYLLGSLIGRWVVPEGTDPTLAEALNVGISAVVPIYKILEVINHPELVEMRKIVKEQYRKKKAATTVLDTSFGEAAQTTEEGEEIPIPDESQFFTDLKKASRKKNH